MEDKKGPLLKALGKAITTSLRPNMYLEKIPSNTPSLKQTVYQLLSQDLRIDAFDTLASIDSSTPIDQYIDSVLYAARFLLANKLSHECYLFLIVAQSRIESEYGSPYDFTLYEEIGNMFYLTKNYTEAIKSYERLLDLGERIPAMLFFNIGVCYQEIGNYPLAIQAYLKSINLDSSLVKVIIRLGQCYQALNQFDKSIGTFKQLPPTAESFTCIGNAYFFMKNYEEAIAHYLKALKISPSAGVYNNLGAALKKTGLLQDAIFAFNDSLALESSGDTVANLIALYIEVGKTDDAEKLFLASQKALSSQDRKYFNKFITEKQARARRATVIMGNFISAISKTPSVSVSPEGNSMSANASAKKAANIFLKKVRK